MSISLLGLARCSVVGLKRGKKRKRRRRRRRRRRIATKRRFNYMLGYLRELEGWHSSRSDGHGREGERGQGVGEDDIASGNYVKRRLRLT